MRSIYILRFLCSSFFLTREQENLVQTKKGLSAGSGAAHKFLSCFFGRKVNLILWGKKILQINKYIYIYILRIPLLVLQSNIDEGKNIHNGAGQRTSRAPMELVTGRVELQWSWSQDEQSSSSNGAGHRKSRASSLPFFLIFWPLLHFFNSYAICICIQ